MCATTSSGAASGRESGDDLPAISVTIATLNAARTLDRCLASLRAQDYPPDKVEIVIADAGSTDDTLAIAKKHRVNRIVPNPLMTGEAGKAAAIEASSGDILALVDSDNIFDDRDYFRRAARVFSDPSVASAEPLCWTFDPDDTLVNRYSALLGMNDPMSFFLGNYNRWSHLSRRFTRMPVTVVREDEDAIIVDVDHCQAPTFGANGFMIRRAALERLEWQPYFFDIDVFQQAAAAGHNRVAALKTETRHLFCDSVATFRRKQARRIRDYLFHRSHQRRSYRYQAVPKRRYLWFIIATVTVLPLLIQAARGYRHKPDGAWWFHPAACWITLWEYSWGVVRSLFGSAEYDRKNWRQ